MLIEVKNLTHIYSEGLDFSATAIDNVSFNAEQGEFIAIIGHTGSGKSTLVQHLNGLIKATSGAVFADGINLSDKGKEVMNVRHKIGMVFQYPEYQLFEETVLKDVAFAPHNAGLSEEECEVMAKDALRLVGLDPETKGDVSPFSLSGGEKRRVAIAGVIAMDPKVLILDEPTAGLDPEGHDEILKMIKRIKAEKDMTIFFVSHNMDDVANLASRVLVMNEGKLLFDGSPKEVFSHSEELKAIGLNIPDAMAFGKKLDVDALTIDELAEKIANKWQ